MYIIIRTNHTCCCLKTPFCLESCCIIDLASITAYNIVVHNVFCKEITVTVTVSVCVCVCVCVYVCVCVCVFVCVQNTTVARPEDMHILGHSLGAHVAGYAGERLRYLGRITGTFNSLRSQ